jgi:hypothetical protein
VTVLRRGVGEVRLVVGRAPMLTSVEARTDSKRITTHNTPQLSRVDLANHCAAFPGPSLLNTRAVPVEVHCDLKLEYLDVTVLRRGVREVRVVVRRAPAC